MTMQPPQLYWIFSSADIAINVNQIRGNLTINALPASKATISLTASEAGRQVITNSNFDTIGGLIAHRMGRVPTRGEVHDMAGLRFEVMLARAGAVKWFKVRPLA